MGSQQKNGSIEYTTNDGIGDTDRGGRMEYILYQEVPDTPTTIKTI